MSILKNDLEKDVKRIFNIYIVISCWENVFGGFFINVKPKRLFCCDEFIQNDIKTRV